MAELSRDRARAAKLSNAKKLTDEQRQWLDAYKARVTKATIAKGKALPSSGRVSVERVGYADTARGSVSVERAMATDEVPRRVGTPAAFEPREQLALPAVVVHETKRLDDSLSAEDFQWSPIVPPTPDDAPPPPPGTPPPAAAGTPLVDDAQTAAGQGDPGAAEQFAALVVFIDTLGIDAAMELLPPMSELPAAVGPIYALLTSQKLHAGALEAIGEGAKRFAIKHNMRSLPLADELMVFGSMAASVAALVAAFRKRQDDARKAPSAPTPTTAPDTSSRKVGDVDPSTSGTPTALQGLIGVLS